MASVHAIHIPNTALPDAIKVAAPVVAGMMTYRGEIKELFNAKI